MAYLDKKDIIEILNARDGKLKFHIKWRNGNARITINDRKTKYYAGGYGYDKESAVIAYLINDLLGPMDYKNAYTGSTSGVRTICSGIGTDSVKNALEMIGSKLELLYYGDNFDLYELDLSKHLERINNGI